MCFRDFPTLNPIFLPFGERVRGYMIKRRCQASSGGHFALPNSHIHPTKLCSGQPQHLCKSTTPAPSPSSPRDHFSRGHLVCGLGFERGKSNGRAGQQTSRALSSNAAGITWRRRAYLVAAAYFLSSPPQLNTCCSTNVGVWARRRRARFLRLLK